MLPLCFRTLMDRKYVDAVTRIIHSKDHLRQNLDQIRFGNSKSCKSINSTFTHDLPVVLCVKTGSLWQSPRSYMQKHLGKSVWRIEDGIKVTINRVHQK